MATNQTNEVLAIIIRRQKIEERTVAKRKKEHRTAVSPKSVELTAVNRKIGELTFIRQKTGELSVIHRKIVGLMDISSKSTRRMGDMPVVNLKPTRVTTTDLTNTTMRVVDITDSKAGITRSSHRRHLRSSSNTTEDVEVDEDTAATILEDDAAEKDEVVARTTMEATLDNASGMVAIGDVGKSMNDLYLKDGTCISLFCRRKNDSLGDI